jgi:hypothetical protein
MEAATEGVVQRMIHDDEMTHQFMFLVLICIVSEFGLSIGSCRRTDWLD